MVLGIGEILKNKVELLAPAGHFDAAIRAIDSGANAVYVGGKAFNARQGADNLTDEELKEVIEYAHLRNASVNITLNVLYKNEEIKDVLKFVSKMYSYGADAFIIQDIGLFSIIKKNFPDIKLHASTQMTIHNDSGVKFLEELGFDRVVLSRELSLEEIKNIVSKTSLEIETFIHGALCVSYSGRCLMSSMLGGRSGNRGRCAQPCRLKYKLIKDEEIIKDDYLLCPKDISTVEFLDELINSGIHTFKIEGRMKKTEYVALVSAIYRKYIDLVYENNFKVEPKDLKELTQIFNRGGSFSQGYFNNWAGFNMISPSPKNSGVKIGQVVKYDKRRLLCTIELTDELVCGDGIEIWTKTEPHTGTNISKKASKGDIIVVTVSGNIEQGDFVYKSFDKALEDKVKSVSSKDACKQTVYAEIKAFESEPFYIKLTSENGICVELKSIIVEKAQNIPLDEEKIKAQLSRTGNTPFKICFKSLEIGDNIYIPVSELNKIRREATEMLEKEITKSYKRKEIAASYLPKSAELASLKALSVSVLTKEQFETCVKSKIERIYIEMTNETINNINYYVNQAHENNIELFAALPSIVRDTDKLEQNIKILEQSEIDGYLMRNYMQIQTEKKIALDYTFNILNSSSLEFLKSISETCTLSPELNLAELEEISDSSTEIIVYGRLPLMQTHQCPIGLYAGEKESGRFCKLKNNAKGYELQDRKDIRFPIITDCESCVCSIYNSSPIFLLNRFRDLENIHSSYYRLVFTDETAKEIEDLIYSYNRLLLAEQQNIRVNELIKAMTEKGYTNGHFLRGVL